MSQAIPKFLSSYAKHSDCPSDKVPEVALIGRSNVGKSSLLNAITGQKKLAKVSGKPGKTQTINLFDMGQWRLVDLPGYGYAKVSKKLRESWQPLIWDYLRLRPNLFLTLVLLDIRLPPQEIDLNFINSLGQEGVPLHLVFTKADKLGKTRVQQAVAHYEKALQTYWEDLPTIFATSAEAGTGVEELSTYLHQLIDQQP